MDLTLSVYKVLLCFIFLFLKVSYEHFFEAYITTFNLQSPCSQRFTPGTIHAEFSVFSVLRWNIRDLEDSV